MRVTEYATYMVPPRWLFLRITTADGTVGWGEPVIEGKAATVQQAVDELMSAVVLGADPHTIGDLWQMMYRGGFYRGGPILMSAIAGIDQALWDIKGKSLGAPVHTLLGGALRERIPVYQWIGGDRPTEVVDAAIARRDQGFTAVKMNATAEFDRIAAPTAVDAVATRLGAVRTAVGKDFNIALDFHGRVSRSAAPRLLAALEPHTPMFVEEPVLPTQPSELARLSAQTTIPIATGERLYSRWDFRPLLESQAADIIQPDISHAGGISEVAKIAAMAETYDVALAPHCPLGPIALAASLQVDAIAPTASIQEQSAEIHYNDGGDVLDYVADPSSLAIADGHLAIPDAPGLGITPDIETIEERAVEDIAWHNPIWRDATGAVTEW